VAVAFDAVGPSSAGTGGITVTTLSWTHTAVASGVTLLASCSLDNSPDTGITMTCKCDGVLMTSLGTKEGDSQTTGYLQAWSISGISSGAHTILVTASSAVNDLSAGSISFTGAASLGTPVTASGTSITASAAVTGTAAPSLVAGFALSGDTIASTTSPATSRYLENLRGPNGDGAGNNAGATSPGPGTVTMSWGLTAAGDPWAVIAVELLAAPSGGAPAAAQPGQTWLRQFHHRQVLLPGAAAVTAPQAGPPVYPLDGPAGLGRRAPGPFLKGRVTGISRGTSAQAGPPLTPLRGPVAPKGRGLPPRGRSSSRAGAFAQAGPPVYPLHGPVRSRPQPLRPGRTATMVALPLFYAGPPVYPLHGPVRTRPQPPPRGRAQGRTGTFTSTVPQSGPPVYPLHGPVRNRPQPPPRGHAASNRGTFAQAGPPVYPLHGQVCARRPSRLPGGRCRGSAGTFTSVIPNAGPPVYPLHGPVRTRPQPPPRGRCAGSRGIRHQAGPPLTPLRGPVAPFRPGPYRSGLCTGNDGTSGQLGPRVYPLQRPVRSRIPHRPRGGRTAGNTGAPVFVPPFTLGALTAADVPLAALTTATAAGGSGGVLTASDTRLGGPGG